MKELNISFTKLGEEECEHCLPHDVHIKEDHKADAMTTTECQECRQWEDHKGRAESARIRY